jgi:hypothetical protein
MSPARAPAADPGGALSLRTWFAEAEAAASIARQVYDTPFVPDSLKRWSVEPNPKQGIVGVVDMDGTVAVVSAALLAGQELGFSPMASLRSMDVIKGTPALRALALRALVQAHGHDIVVVESTQTRARVRGCRAGGDVQESIWTTDRAKLLGLWPGTEFSNWRKQPQAQLVARATAEVARWIAADSILGLPYIAEELADREVEEAALPGDEGAPGTEPRAARKRGRALLPAPTSPMPPPANEPPPAPKVTRDQIKALNAALAEAGVRNRAEAAAAVGRHVDRDIRSAADLTYDEAVRVLDALQAEAADRARAAQDTEPGPDDPGDDQEGAQGDDAADV